MSRNKTLKYIITFIALSISIGLITACSENDYKNYHTEKTMISDSSLQESNKGTIADPFGKYTPPVDITFIRGIDEDFAQNVLPKTPGETIQDNRWLTVYREELGINVKYAWTIRGNEVSEQFSQKINVTLASGDLPDVMLVNSTQLRQLVDSGQVEDMTEYFDKYAAPLTKEIYNQESSATLDSATINGRLMAIPEPYSYAEVAQYLWIRDDWLKNLGLEAPKSMEDLLEISWAFTNLDPDRNGKNDTYGLAISKDIYGGTMSIEGFFAGYHSYPNMWIEDNSGKLVWGSTLPETKKALSKLAGMYKSGEIDREFSVKDGSKVAETIAKGQVGIEFGAQWNPMYPLIKSFNNDNDADWTGYPLVSDDNSKVMVPLKYNQTRIFAVKKGYPHPEALVKLINMHLEKNWGKTADFNKYYMPAENDGVGVWKFSPVVPTPPYKNLNAFLEIEAARKNKNFSDLRGEAKAIQSNLDAYNSGDKSKWGWEKIYGIDGVMGILKSYKTNGQLLPEKFVGASTNTMAEKKAVMDMLEREVFIKIIMGESPISDFDKFVDDWYKIGGEEITKEVNSWYASIK